VQVKQMPSFVLKVGTPDGQIVERQIDAADAEAASQALRQQGLHVFQARRSRLVAGTVLPRSRKVISTDRFLVFNQELLALVRAGLPILSSLDLMLERQKSPRFRQVLREIRDKIQSGVSLSDAFASYGNAFPPIYYTSLRAGERAGELEGVLRKFLRYQKLIVALRRKVMTALIYPTVLATLSIGMIFVMLTYVIPKFTEFYTGFDAELPALTRGVIALAFFLRGNILIILGLVVLAGFALRQWSATAMGRMILDRLKLRIPFAGGVFHRFAIMQFTQALGTLLGGGTPMVPSIETAAESVTNQYIAQRISRIAQQVREGEPLWRSLESTGIMSDLTVEMVKVGESTGALVEMLSHVSEFYDEEIEAHLARMTAMIEPAILVVLGAVIAGLILAFYLPLFQLTSVGTQYG
jgi:type IV pilus assembly protein PilC